MDDELGEVFLALSQPGAPRGPSLGLSCAAGAPMGLSPGVLWPLFVASGLTVAEIESGGIGLVDLG